MKATSFWSLVLLGTFIMLSQKVQAQTYRLPYVEAQSNMNLFILGAETGDTTKIDLSVCNFTIDNFKFWFSPKGASDAYYLEDQATSKTYAYLGESGNSSKSMPYSVAYNNCDTITLYFEKVDDPLSTFNMIEGKKNNSWDFRGVDFTEQNRDIIQRLNGRKFVFTERVKHQVNWLFSETYTFRYYGTIENFNDEGQVLLNLTNVEIVDPSWASVNYMQNRDYNLRKAQSNLGTRIWRNAAAGNIIIW